MINSGHLLENLVFIALRRMANNIYYYKTKTGKEVDFIIQNKDHSRILIQVSESISEPKTRKREIEALNEAMLELKLNNSILVTRNHMEQLEVTSGKIEIVPVWYFLFKGSIEQ